MDKKEFAIGILAGGKSSRMGQEKALLKYGQNTFLEHMVKKLSPLGEVIVSARQEQRLPYIDNCRLVYDLYEGCGPLAGIASVLTTSSCCWNYICAVDMPKLSKDIVAYLQEFCSSDYDCVCLTVAEQAQPLCAFYRKDILPVVETQLKVKDYKLQHLLGKLRTKYVDIERSCFDAACLANINTTEEYVKLIKLGPKVFCVSGLKNTGKTTLICNLLPLFINDGYKVTVIKHDGHDFEIDHPSTDTAKFSVAGAEQSIIFSAKKYAIMGNKAVAIEELLQYCQACDYVIIEGLKNSAYPKIEVMRGQITNVPICDDKTVLALVVDNPMCVTSVKPVYDSQEYQKLYKLLLGSI